jgi:hypothetical protein
VKIALHLTEFTLLRGLIMKVFFRTSFLLVPLILVLVVMVDYSIKQAILLTSGLGSRFYL